MSQYPAYRALYPSCFEISTRACVMPRYRSSVCKLLCCPWIWRRVFVVSIGKVPANEINLITESSHHLNRKNKNFMSYNSKYQIQQCKKPSPHRQMVSSLLPQLQLPFHLLGWLNLKAERGCGCHSALKSKNKCDRGQLGRQMVCKYMIPSKLI